MAAQIVVPASHRNPSGHDHADVALDVCDQRGLCDQVELSERTLRFVDVRGPVQRADDTVIARTWVEPTEGRSFSRHTEILRASDRRLLARARTLWFPLDAQTGRPARVGADVHERFSVPAQGGTPAR